MDLLTSTGSLVTPAAAGKAVATAACMGVVSEGAQGFGHGDGGDRDTGLRQGHWP